MVKDLYKNVLLYNCSYYEMKSKVKSDLLIVFLGTREFIITNNYFGCVAIGKRFYNWDTNKTTYIYELLENSICLSQINTLITNYQLARFKSKADTIIRVKDLDDEREEK